MLWKFRHTVFETPPAGDDGNSVHVISLLVRHTDWHDVTVELYGRLQLEKGQVVLESGRVVCSVDNDTAHVARNAALRFQLAGYVIFAEHRD